MSLLQFAHYTFNSLTLELSAKGSRVPLRPKTSELLRELILNRDQIIGKRQLVQRIWHSEYVTDQSVFQAVSELRSQLAPLIAIRTFPNRGYQWVLPTIELSPIRRRARIALAASVVLAVTGLIGVGSSYTASQTAVAAGVTNPGEIIDVNVKPAPTPGLPAMLVFSEGASALQRGDTAQALEWLKLSVAERPDFVEARLLLAEAYLLAGDALQARQTADNVMSAPGSSANAYTTIAAMDLISRADQQLGQMNSALEWATRAADRANSNGYECTAADLHDRVLALVKDHDYSTAQLASPVFASDFAQRMLQAAFAGQAPGNLEGAIAQSPLPPGHSDRENSSTSVVDGLLGEAGFGPRPAHCARYRSGPSGQLNPVVPALPSVAATASIRAGSKSLI